MDRFPLKLRVTFMPLLLTAMAAMKKKMKWTTEDLTKQLNDIEEKKLSYREAGAKYGIPKSTLCDYKVGKVEVGAQTRPIPILTAAEEQKLIDYAFKMSKIGYGQAKQQKFTMVHFKERLPKKLIQG